MRVMRKPYKRRTFGIRAPNPLGFYHYKNGKLKLHNWDVIHEELGNKYK